MGTSRKKFVYIFVFCLTVFFTVANIYIRRNEEKFRSSFKSYLTLYYPEELPLIKFLDKSESGYLLIGISSSKQAEKWKASIDGGKETEISGGNPKLKLLEGLHSYKLESDAFPDISMKINFVPSIVYKKAKNSNKDVIDIVNSSIPLGEFERYPVDFFVCDSTCYSSAEIDQASQIIEREIKIKPEDPTDEKIKKLARFLICRTGDKGGIPSKKARDMTPLQQYLGALKGEVKLWCHNNAEIYVFFANAIGIPTRKVSVGGEFDACSLSGHAFAESYIKEQNRWAYVDVTSANILVRNTEGLYLNTLDLFYLTLLGAYPENFKISFVDHGNLHEQSYVGDLTYHEKYYFRRDAAFNFPIPEKNSFLKKEFFEKYDYIFNPAFVHSLHASNAKHYLALFFVYGEIVLVLFWLIIFAVYAKFLLSLVKRKN